MVDSMETVGISLQGIGKLAVASRDYRELALQI
jgi:hypothetical protein